MNGLRMLIDLSHVGYRTAADVMALSKRPVIFSHSNALTLCNSLRNIPDELIRAAAKTGGTVGATLWPPMVRHEKRPTVDDWAEQIAHMVNLVGVEHVAFGSDLSENKYKSEAEWQASFGPRGIYPEVTAVLGPWFQFNARLTEGYESLAQTPRLIEALRKRGFAADATDKIMGGNLLRVYREVWANGPGIEHYGYFPIRSDPAARRGCASGRRPESTSACGKRRGARRGWRLLHHPQGRDALHCWRIRLRQEHDGVGHHGLVAETCRADCRRTSHLAGRWRSRPTKSRTNEGDTRTRRVHGLSGAR